MVKHINSLDKGITHILAVSQQYSPMRVVQKCTSQCARSIARVPSVKHFGSQQSRELRDNFKRDGFVIMESMWSRDDMLEWKERIISSDKQEKDNRSNLFKCFNFVWLPAGIRGRPQHRKSSKRGGHWGLRLDGAGAARVPRLLSSSPHGPSVVPRPNHTAGIHNS